MVEDFWVMVCRLWSGVLRMIEIFDVRRTHVYLWFERMSICGLNACLFVV